MKLRVHWNWDLLKLVFAETGIGWNWNWLKLGFTEIAFFWNWYFSETGIFWNWCLLKLIFSEIGIYQNWYFLKLEFAEIGIFCSWCFLKSEFTEIGIFWNWYLLKLEFAEFGIDWNWEFPALTRRDPSGPDQPRLSKLPGAPQSPGGVCEQRGECPKKAEMIFLYAVRPRSSEGSKVNLSTEGFSPAAPSPQAGLGSAGQSPWLVGSALNTPTPQKTPNQTPASLFFLLQ